MSELSIQLRVTSVRSAGKFGGAIFAGVTTGNDYFVAVCDYKIIPEATLVNVGQHWTITGVLRKWNDESQIDVTCAEMLIPTGRNIVDWIAQSSECAGIGPVKAGRLYDRFGPQLVEHIQSKNFAVLTEIISHDAAQLLCHAFEIHLVAGTLLWLDRLAINRRIGKKIVDFYANEAQSKIEENPYRLISFAESWRKVDELARSRFGIQLNDARRLDAAVEEVLCAAMQDGHTCLPISKVKTRLSSLLRSSDLAETALVVGSTSTQFQYIGDMLHATGAYFIERYIATRLQLISDGESNGQQSLLASLSGDPEEINNAIVEYESVQGFTLTPEQRVAVTTSARSNLSLILGGAGTGKTTVLKAFYRVLEAQQEHVAIFQFALAGRAAQRMSEATGRESMTIASFLLNVDSSQLGQGSVVVVDEMSMVDAILMYRLLRHIPLGTRIVLVGDPSQLPPIGPGLVLHALAGLPAVQQTELTVTKRQSAESGIPAVSAAIRTHRIPEYAEYSGIGTGVSFVSCKDTDIESTVRRVYGELGADGSDYSVQVLSITNSGYGGVRNLNMAFHNEFRRDAAIIYSHDNSFGIVGAKTLDRVSIRVGDLVMYTENDYTLGLRNGSLGVVLEGLDTSSWDAECCICEFDGILYRLNSRQVEALRHAYSITIHKAQGSQFPRVIIPLRRSRLLDQTLIYTGVTRGVEQVVLVGDVEMANAAIVAPASASLRHVALPSLLRMKA